MNETTPTHKYWQSLEEWRNDSEFQKLAEQEFMSSPIRETMGATDSSEGGWARREFLKLMGASLALTSFGCVRRPAEKIVPYVKKPNEIIEGIANFYSSSWNDGSEVFGLVVKTREGRPIKVEGNPSHPMNKGGMSARAHAHILSLYDPDRLAAPMRKLFNEARTNSDSVSTTLEKADEAIAAQLKKGGAAVLTSSIVSPSLQSALNSFRSAFNARQYTWDVMGAEKMARAQEMSYGSAVVPRFRFDKAKMIVSANADFLGTYIAPTENQTAFAKMRNPDGEMSKLVVFESLLTLTGANADFRARIRPSHTADVLLGLLHELSVNQKVTRYAGDTAVTNKLKPYADIASVIGLSPEVFAEIAKELYANRGQSIVIAGEDLKAQVAANMLNSALGNDGATIDYRNAYTGFQGSSTELVKLVADLNAGSIKTLIIHGMNVVHAAPASLGLVEALRKAEMVIYTGSHNDDTGKLAEFILSDSHPMEAWGDAEGQKGLYSIQQPTIQPMGQTRAFGDTLISIMRASGRDVKASWYEHVRATAAARGASGETGWENLLQKGVIEAGGRDGSAGGRSVSGSALSVLDGGPTPLADLELVLYPTVGLRDGSLANVSWLQEFPDPISKLCWDNYLTVAPATAQSRKLAQGQIVKVTVGDKTVEVPVHIQPGQQENTIGLAVGYGQKAAGRVANGVGINAYELSYLNKNDIVYSGLTATVASTATKVPMANVAGHNSMEGRQIVIEATLADYKKNPQSNIHRHKIFSAWSGHKYTGHKWGMAIDLNSCTGCGSCMIACQSENNIHVVGKKNVINGREMHWIRIDRYYVGDQTNPDTVFMPVTCQHCDNAPCETVCPVLATVHSDEGTNDMIYNRCVGTRYCSNNCPYKVRRFNWFNYVKEIPSPVHMALNPDVTVRPRGVMEKCTFCTHRIHSEKSKAKIEGRKMKDGDVTVACQDSCPTGAITFGDVNDPESAVSKVLKRERTYTLLEELNAAPAVKYQSKVRNTHALKEVKGHGNEKGHH